MNKQTLHRLLFFLGIAALLMTFGSMTSFLFPLHTGVDQNCFLTVAREWLHGRLPYRDLYEQKGPLLYALHLPAAAMPKLRFFGVYLVQTAAWTLILNGICRLTGILLPGCSERRKMMAAAWSALVIVTARCYSRGDNAEEFCLIPVLFALCDLLETARSEKAECKTGILLRNGILAGCVLWIKFSMLGFFIGWCLVAGILIWHDSGFVQALKAGMLFLLGIALSSLPWILYFGMHGALRDLIQVYFVSNATLYPRKITLLDRFLDFFRSDLYKNPVMVLLILSGIFCMTKGKKLREQTAVWVPAGLLYIFVFIGGVRYRYYLLILGAYVPFGIAALDSLRVKYLPDGNHKILRIAGLTAYPLLLFWRGNCLPYFKMSEKDYPQVQFAAYMQKGDVLLNYGFLDGGFYLMSGTKLPESRYFCKLNIYREQLPEMYEEQERIIDERAADYAVIRREKAETWEEKYTYAPFEAYYERIAEAEEPNDGYCYALYRRREP
ncbi:MAG: hypothetical protein IKI58_06655 [Oscillospiraceae bacterium]|nr:hypothetical protein [Oscillospiraceae bacterium]